MFREVFTLGIGSIFLIGKGISSGLDRMSRNINNNLEAKANATVILPFMAPVVIEQLMCGERRRQILDTIHDDLAEAYGGEDKIPKYFSQLFFYPEMPDKARWNMIFQAGLGNWC